MGGLLPGMANKKEKMHLATITILVKDRQKHSVDVNRILTENGHFIIARLGVNVQRHCVSNCTAMIVVAVEASAKDVARITKQLNGLYGIVAKASVM
jgi:metal-responsive CopG/Arc/MetJ family transcriptional regulator